MRITRSLGYKFSIQQYESMETMASTTVTSADLGVSDEKLCAMTDAELDQHVADLEVYCDDMLQRQLAPLLSEADEICEKRSAAHDVADYHKGQRGA